MNEPHVTESAVFRKQHDIVHRTIAGEALLVPIRGELADMQRIYSLNPVADFIWERIDGAATVAAIADAVIDGFETDADGALQDTHALIAELAAAGLIVRT